jgi:hypothetical protein
MYVKYIILNFCSHIFYSYRFSIALANVQHYTLWPMYVLVSLNNLQRYNIPRRMDQIGTIFRAARINYHLIQIEQSNCFSRTKDQT